MTLILTQTKQAYKLNDTELNMEDLCLLLEMNGFEVPRDLPCGVFFMKVLESLSQLDTEEFYLLFNEFITYTPQEKVFFTQLVTDRRLQTAFSSPN